MGILCAILSLPVSVLLVRWLIKRKKENPFEKGDVRGLLLAGILSMVAAVVVTLLIVVIRAFQVIGYDTLKLWISNPDPVTIQNSFNEIRSRAPAPTFWSTFAGTFLSIGLVEAQADTAERRFCY